MLSVGVEPGVPLSPLIGRTYQLFDWSGVTPAGTFDAVVGQPAFVWDFASLYSHGTVELLHVVGDADDSGAVDIRDLMTLASNWNTSASNWTAGDFNGDGFVNAADLGMLASNWQFGVVHDGSPADLPAAAFSLGLPVDAVPEPGIAALVATSFAGLMTRRRPRRT